MANGNGPATRQDVIDAVERAKEELRTDIEGAVKASEDRLTELVRNIETQLLQAFYGFADSMTKRVTQSDLNQALVLGRVATLENRMLEVEKRLNIPPAT